MFLLCRLRHRRDERDGAGSCLPGLLAQAADAAKMIDAERQYCCFLRFVLAVEPDGGTL
jgi:hypothetical protein